MGGLGGESRKMAGKRKEEKEKDKRRSKKEMGKEGQARIGGRVRTVVRQLLPACGNPATHAQHSSRAGDPSIYGVAVSCTPLLHHMVFSLICN